MTFSLERYCLKCKVFIYFDDTEKQWGCDCTAAGVGYDEDGPTIEWEPDYWIGLNIPESVAVCPKCGAALFIEDIDEWDADTGIPTETGFHFDCSTAPLVDSDGWDEWFNWHWSTPYIDWLPLQDKVYQWFVNQHHDNGRRTMLATDKLDGADFDNND